MASPYNRDVQNGIRLSCLLINEGTKCLKNLLLKEIAKKNLGNLQTVLNLSTEKQMMKDLRFKQPKLLNEDQFNLLYPKKGKVKADTFDLSLLCLLLTKLCNIQFQFSYSDTDFSISADVCRIRHMRNMLYGHVVKTGMDDGEFKDKWSKLSEVLIRLGSKCEDIDQWKSQTLSPQDCEDYRNDIIAITESDLHDMHVIAQNVMKMIQNHGECFTDHSDHMASVLSDMQSLLQCHKSETEEIITKLKFILDNLEDSVLNIIMKSVYVSSMSIKSELKQYFDEQKKQNAQLLQSQQQLALQQETISKKLDDIEINTKKLSHIFQSQEDMANFNSFATILNESKDSFKVLFINSPQSKYDKESMIIFGKALGSINWDVVLDMNFHSRTSSGLYDTIINTFKCKKDFVACTYSNVQSKTGVDANEKRIDISEGEFNKQRIIRGECALYILANGCKDTDCDPPTGNFAKAVTNIMPVLNDISSKFPGKKELLTMLFVLSDDALIGYNRLLQMFRMVVESNEEKLDITKSKTLMFFMNPELKHSLKDVNELWGFQQCETTLRQAAKLFFCTYCTANETEFLFPGTKGFCAVTNKEMVQMKGILELYHKDIGKLNTEGLTNDQLEDKYCEIKFAFLKGHELTPAALGIHIKEQVYVERQEMSDLYDVINKELENRKVWNTANLNSYITLEHDPSGGGTTSIRFVLYQLRKTYPCAIIHQISEKLFEILKNMYEQSRLPLLLVLDNTEYNITDAEQIQQQLHNRFIKALVVFVRHYFPKHSHTNKEFNYFIPSKISNREEKLAFNKLYQTNKKKMELNKVFLFGLVAFTDEYQKLHKHIEKSISLASFEQKLILQIVCFIWKYSHISTKAAIINRVLLLNKAKTYVSFDDLGCMSDFLIFQNDGLRPAHECILAPSLKWLLGENKNDQLKSFVDIMLGLIEEDCEGKKESTEITYIILVQRTGKTQWSYFLSDLEEHCGPQHVLSFLLDIESLNLKYNTMYLSHYRMLQARYLMYKLQEPDKSISVMEKALLLKPGDSILTSSVYEHTLLNTYGFLLRLRLLKRFEGESNKKLKESGFLLDAENDVQKAIWAFRRAQSSTRNINAYVKNLYDPRSFVGEARIRALLLQFHFVLNCNKDHEKFSDYVKTTDNKLVAESEDEGLEALQKFELLWDSNKLNREDMEKTLESARKAKFDFLRLRFDEGTSIKKVLATMKKNCIPCDIGTLVRSELATVKNDRNFIYRPWNELNLEKLMIIYDTIDTHISNSKLLRCNFKDIIYAMIYIRQLNVGKNTKQKLKRYTLDYATQCASLWVEKYKDDFQGYFMLGVLLLVSGIKEQKHFSISKALENLEKSKKMGTKTREFTKKRFVIGQGDGLEALIPFKILHAPDRHVILEEFTGRQIDKSKVNVRPFDKLVAKLDFYSDGSENVKTSFHQQQLLTFKIAIAMDTLIAFDAKPVDENETE